MITLALLFINVLGYSNYDENPTYNIRYPAKDNPTEMSNIIYDRNKCSTCCRVMFASDYNFENREHFSQVIQMIVMLWIWNLIKLIK